jgi:hypothetical protein
MGQQGTKAVWHCPVAPAHVVVLKFVDMRLVQLLVTRLKPWH